MRSTGIRSDSISDEPGRDRERHLHRAGDRSREATRADRCTRRPPAAAAAIRRESSVARAESPSARAQSVGALPGVHRAARAAPPTRVRRPATRLPGVCGPERRRRLTPATRASRLAQPTPPSRPALPARVALTPDTPPARRVAECGNCDTHPGYQALAHSGQNGPAEWASRGMVGKAAPSQGSREHRAAPRSHRLTGSTHSPVTSSR
jgi:hypothetical protein